MSERRYVIMRSDYSSYLSCPDGKYVFTEKCIDKAIKGAEGYGGRVVPDDLCDKHITLRKENEELKTQLGSKRTIFCSICGDGLDCHYDFEPKDGQFICTCGKCNSKKDESSVALDRATGMMSTPFNELPKLAQEFAEYNCNRLGACGEVLITSFAVYAQCVEGLCCKDDLYKADDEDKKWFKEHKDE